MSNDILQQFNTLLLNILKSKSGRERLIYEYENYVNANIRNINIDGSILDFYNDLLYDFAYYVEDEKMRSQDPSYFGDEKLEKIINMAIRQLEEKGIIFSK